MRFTMRPCPCGECGKFVIPEINTSVESSMDRELAERIVDRWNTFEEFTRVLKENDGWNTST